MEGVRTSRKFWRGIGITVLGLWLIVTVINLFYLDPSKLPQSDMDIITLSWFIAGSGATVLGLIGAVVFPERFYIYAGIFCFWGLGTLIDGGSVLSLLLYLLGLGFAYKQGFFKRFRRVKALVAMVLGISGITVQYRYGIAVVINTVLNCVGFCMIAGLGYLLFLPELRRVLECGSGAEVQESVEGAGETSQALGAGASRKDLDNAILERIGRGEKYECIAIELNISVATVKRRAKRLFEGLQVRNREEFLNRYGGGPSHFV
jgi:hypothetical protein